VFCPSYCNPAYNGYNGKRRPVAYDIKNTRGNNHHENYVGINAIRPEGGDGAHMLPADEANIGWMNQRISYGFRPTIDINVKKLSQTKGSMSYLSDVWMANANYWHIHIDEVSHSFQGATEAKINTWYFDGHVARFSFSKDKYFCSMSTGSSLPTGFMNNGTVTGYPKVTWEVLFEGGTYPY
jgi:prepilin-type processing-associated H-X9-DG protein